ncbi:carboxypeptidase-like regulatory domain-containing protein [Chryseobacterium schmidteae]|uniref:carboxypeptidase-like regulatory domain-containing protein n=1 Tax=Chryseobacterium schmidteae TaxID=2730404 RepID=UPI00158C75DE|nr:carboxypeptidase-like regulatory domain-containing protein [Chryseobacterium schmidteae]
MKKTILLFLMICPFYVLLSQTIKGTVVNDIDKPIANVNIYLDGTKTGTVSAADGSFSITSNNNNSLVFQKDDYETFTVKTSEVLNKKLKVVLIKAKEIEEVVIIPFTETAYKNYIKYFLDSFIGSDQSNVKIKNQRSLRFSYDKMNKILRVKAPQTLIIENKNLGYLIDYNLQDFVADFENKTTTYMGTSFFKETKNTDKVKLNRMNAYDGSSLHFLRSVYAGKTKDESFIVNQVTKFPNSKYPTEEELQHLKDFTKTFKPTKTIVIPEDIQDIMTRKNNEPKYRVAVTKPNISEIDYTEKSDNRLFLDFKDILEVKHDKYFYELKSKEIIKSKFPIKQMTHIHSNDDTYEIYSNGNNSNPNLMYQGEFTKNKIEFLLPLDYQLGD